jgi:hypothetical protein
LVDGVPTTVTINYPVIDEGKTRFQENDDRIQRNLERARTLAEIAAAHEKLQTYYSEGTAALKAVPGEMPWTEDDRLRHVHDAIKWFEKSQQDDADPLTAIIGEHLAAQTKRDIWQDKSIQFGELPNEAGGGEAGERAPRKDAGDLVVGAGLAIFSRLSDALESFIDPTPSRDIVERDLRMAEKQPAPQPKIQQVTEQHQRQSEAEVASHRKQELEAYLQQRDRERHIDRGR